jgi:CubicO group peptidase (beta-lactamase class C family)
VERGLRSALQIAGREPETFTLAERMERYRVPGVALAAVDDGEVSWAGGHGVAVAGGAPVHATTLFQAASISKAVSAVAVLALVEHGAIDLDADVNSQLRSWQLPASEHTAEQPVTVRHLLSHRAGTTVPGFPGYPAGTALPSAVDVLNGVNGASTPAVGSFARPGTVSQYSGGGSTIVQQLVCDVTDRPFAELVHDLVLRPLGMVDSAFDQPLARARVHRAASGHDGEGRPTPGGHHDYAELQAAGLWTTAVDLARWLIAVQSMLRGDTGGPISPETALLMVTPVDDGPFGLGPEIAGLGGDVRFGHTGSNEGFRGFAEALVERPVGGVVLTNAEGGNSLMGEVRLAFADEYEWGAVGAPPIELAEVNPDVLRSYAGRYIGPFDRPLRLVFDDGELFSPASYGRRRMLPLGATTFLDEETGATLEVHLDGERVARIGVEVGGNELMSFDPVPATAMEDQ